MSETVRPSGAHAAGLRARKRFGQHFLVRPDIARRIVAAAELDGSETVLEIGPGHGALTDLLAAAAAELYVVEVDRDLARRLGEEHAARPNVHVVEADILEVDLVPMLGARAPVTVVANLPYNISTPLLFRLLDSPELFRRLVLMLQREVADRIAAPPGSKTYGRLSVTVQLVASVRPVIRVPSSAFTPRPKVDSAVIVIEPFHERLPDEAERRAVREVVRTAFSQRRKQLVNSLAPLTADPAKVLERLHIDPRRRPESLSVEDFRNLAGALAADR